MPNIFNSYENFDLNLVEALIKVMNSDLISEYTTASRQITNPEAKLKLEKAINAYMDWICSYNGDKILMEVLDKDPIDFAILLSKDRELAKQHIEKVDYTYSIIKDLELYLTTYNKKQAYDELLNLATEKGLSCELLKINANVMARAIMQGTPFEQLAKSSSNIIAIYMGLLSKGYLK